MNFLPLFTHCVWSEAQSERGSVQFKHWEEARLVTQVLSLLLQHLRNPLKAGVAGQLPGPAGSMEA